MYQRALSLCFVLACVVSHCHATSIVFSSSGNNNGQPIAATAQFSLNGTDLQITLTNTAPANTQKYVNSDLLMAVFFGSSALNLDPVSATGSSEVNNSGTTVCASNCNVGNGWEYLSFGSTQYGALNGISAAGLGIFGHSNFGSTSTNLQGGDYGIVPSNFPGTHGDSVNFSPLVRNSVVFDLTAPVNFSLNQINNVVFQYGTSTDETHINASVATPEPASWMLMAAGGLLVFASTLLRKLARV